MSDTQSLDPELAVALVERSPDAMIFAGLDGMIGAWNPAAEHIFGHTAAEAMGQSLDLIIPERFRSAHWTAYDKALESGKDRKSTRLNSSHKTESRMPSSA